MTETREAMRSIDLAELAASSGMSAAISQSATREPYNSPSIQPYQPREMRASTLDLRPAVVSERPMPTGEFTSFSRTAAPAAASSGRTSYDPKALEAKVDEELRHWRMRQQQLENERGALEQEESMERTALR